MGDGNPASNQRAEWCKGFEGRSTCKAKSGKPAIRRRAKVRGREVCFRVQDGGSLRAVESYFRQGLEMERKLAGEYSGIIFVLADFAEDDFLMSRGKVCLASLHRLKTKVDFQRCIEEIKK